MEKTRERTRTGSNRMMRRGKRRPCMFCAEKIDYIDYKDLNKLRRFISERGKILPRRMSGVCARHQRTLTEAIKRARFLALVPYLS